MSETSSRAVSGIGTAVADVVVGLPSLLEFLCLDRAQALFLIASENSKKEIIQNPTKPTQIEVPAIGHDIRLPILQYSGMNSLY